MVFFRTVLVCGVALLVVHVYSQLKESATANVFITDYTSKEHLENKCRLLQPLLVTDSIDSIPDVFSRPVMAVKKAIVETTVTSDPDSVGITRFVPVSKALAELEDNGFTGGHKFIEEIGAVKWINQCHKKLQPDLAIKTDTTFMVGTLGSQTDTVLGFNDRTVIIPTSGKLLLTMWRDKDVPSGSQAKEFGLMVHRRNNRPNSEGEEVELKKGQCLVLPRKWWFSIEYGLDAGALVVRYQSIMNSIAHAPILVGEAYRNYSDTVRHCILSDESQEAEKTSNDKNPQVGGD